MSKSVDYYVFIASPWAYLGSQRLEAIAARHGAALRIIPMGAAEVFAESGGLPLAKRAPQRQAYRLVELQRWSKYLGMPLKMQPSFFPLNESLAARLVIAARDNHQDAVQLAHRMMRGIWAEDRNLADPDVLADIVRDCGFDAAALLAAAETEAVKQAYADGTARANAAKVFGAPSYVLDGEIFWGQDRLDFLDRALAG